MSKTVKEYFSEYSNENYFGPKAGAVTLLGIGENGKHYFYENNGCMGVIYNFASLNLSSFYCSLRCRYEDLYPAALDYWDLILSPTKSPWRKAMTKIEVVKDDMGQPVAFGVLDSTVNTQIAMSACIQARVPHEFSSKLRSYWSFRVNGFDQLESLFLSEHLSLTKEGVYSVIKEKYKHAFDVDIQGISVDRLKEGDPIVNEFTIKNDAHRYTPVTAQWKAVKKFDILNLIKHNQQYTGAFKEAFLKDNGSLNLSKLGVLQGKSLINKLQSTKAEWFK